MKKLCYILLMTFPVVLTLFSLQSCENCEDRTFVVDPALMVYFPYENNTTVTLINQDNIQESYTITPIERLSEIPYFDCTNTFVQPSIIIDNVDSPDFLNIWFNRNDDEFFEDYDLIWAAIQENDAITESGAVEVSTTAEDLESTVNLNGTEYSQVISIGLNLLPDELTTVYLQRNVGFIGFRYRNEIWSLN